MFNNDFQVSWLGTLVDGGGIHYFFPPFLNLIGTTGVCSAVLQEIEEGRQL